MKTIQLITEAVKLMKTIGLPANMKIGSFEVSSKGSFTNWAGRSGEYLGSTVKFNIVFRPDHIQMLNNMGVNIDLTACKMHNLSESAKRFKQGKEAIKQGRYAPYYYGGDPANQQTGVIENWLIAPAWSEIDVLHKLDLICRENHRTEINISNDFTLINAGFTPKTKYSRAVAIESQYFNIKAIRKTAQGKKHLELLPIQKRVLIK